MEEIPAHLRFPTPTGDRRVDVAAVVAWRRRVLDFFAGDATAPWLTDRLRDEFARHDLPDTTGDPAADYDEIRRWREGVASYCTFIWDCVHDDSESIAPPEVLHTLTRLLDPIDVGARPEPTVPPRTFLAGRRRGGCASRAHAACRGPQRGDPRRIPG